MWYIVLSRSRPEQDKNREIHYEEHRQWLDDQHRAGRLLFSGPTSDRAYGIYIMLASSKADAEQVAAQDPHHKRGIRTLEVLEWDVRRALRLDGPSIADLELMARSETQRG